MNGAAKAEALGALFPKSKLHAKAVDILEQSTCQIGVACSGGADSVAAALLVYHHFPQLRERLTILHFNHRLRGISSEEDASFVDSLAKDLDLDFQVATWTDRDLTKTVSEVDAREARQGFFDSFVTAHGRAIILTGHQQEDILETMLLRIARSSDLAGLAAPRPLSEFASGKVMVRPLLDLPKNELLEGLVECQITWMEDTSNLESKFDRNRLRNEIIPAWQEATQFDLSEAASNVREYLEDADNMIEHFLREATFPAATDNPAQLPKTPPPRPLVRRWLLKWLNHLGLGGMFQRSMIGNMAQTVMAGESKQWSAGSGFIRLNKGEIAYEEESALLVPPWEELNLSPGQTVALPEGRTLACSWHDSSASVLSDLKSGKYSEKCSVLIDSESINNSTLVVRPWQPGDRYKSLNAPGNRKLQDMFVDRKIPKEERIHLPVVLTNDSLIVWCPGLPVNHICRITKKTKEILQLTYT
ncbi:MAG: tRNA lysidine(34) synthetase TilS [Opitutales bacterium]|jgi:tRNA(Ile)-lysidine synthase|nr:tRNA lysidine(34) synthetase TilS [Opitutales bacterium]